jgi:hypothetical protein
MNTRAIAAVATYAAPPPPKPGKATLLVEALRAWWKEESEDWDQLVEGPIADVPAPLDVWDCMPTVDSKAVARSSPLFQKCLGIPLDVSLIRPGGYNTLDDMIDHLVPRMEEAAKKKTAKAEQEAQ